MIVEPPIREMVPVPSPPVAILVHAVADGSALGLVLGAALGSFVWPVAGTIVGALLGAWVGLLFGFGGGLGIVLVAFRRRSTAALRGAAVAGALGAGLTAVLVITAGAGRGPRAPSPSVAVAMVLVALVVAALAAALAPEVAGVGARPEWTARFLRVFGRAAAVLLALVALGGLLVGLRVSPSTAWVAPVEALFIAGPSAVALARSVAGCATRTRRSHGPRHR